MCRNRRSVALTVLCLCPLLIALPSAEAAEDIGKQLKSEYQGKVLTLRHFYSGACLRFAADGSTIPQAPVGSWTVDGQLQVQSIQLRGRIRKIEGRRRFMFFDSESHLICRRQGGNSKKHSDHETSGPRARRKVG